MGVPEARLMALVAGRVQGVYFRAYTQREAARLKVCGYALNRLDGAVDVVAEGDRVALEQLVAWLQRGSPNAYVVSVTAQWAPATGAFAGFAVRP